MKRCVSAETKDVQPTTEGGDDATHENGNRPYPGKDAPAAYD